MSTVLALIVGAVFGTIGGALAMGYFMQNNWHKENFEESSDLYGISDFPVIDLDEKTEKVHAP